MTQSFRKLVSGLRNDGNSFRVAAFPDFRIRAARLLPPGRLLGANVVRPSGPSAWPVFPRPGPDRRAGAVRHSLARRRGDTLPRDLGGRSRSRLHPQLAVGDVGCEGRILKAGRRGAGWVRWQTADRPATIRRPSPAIRAAEGAVTGRRRKRAAARRPSCSASKTGAAFQAGAVFVAHGPKSAVDKSRPLILIEFVVAQFRTELGMC